MAALETVSLQEIAEAIRDEPWLDIRHIEQGTLARVRITQLKIGREIDEIVVRQSWFDGDEVRSEEHTFDSEDVRWLRPTAVALEDVKPIERRPGHLPPQRVVEEIVRTVVFLTGGVTAADLTSGGKVTGCIRPRQEAMWLAYEMTDLPPAIIAKDHFGYLSQQPLISVQQKLRYALEAQAPVNYNEAPTAWLDRVRVAMKLVDSNLGVRCRRALDQPWARVL